MTPAALAALIGERAASHHRFLVGIAGPPGAGKSTLAADLAGRLAPAAKVVPMDGFHFDDAVLIARGLRHRKGAPETFDARGFLHLLRRLRSESDVAIPVFDRAMELSRAAADVVGEGDRILLIEGNYLLLRDEPWSAVRPLLDFAIFVEEPHGELHRRLGARWASHGKTAAEARQWIETNDAPNIRLVLERSGGADLTLRGTA